MNDWRSTAACLGEDPELFFPIGTTHPDDLLRMRQAKAICADCLSRKPCLSWAMDNRADYGIWGGLTEGERSSLRRRQQRQRRASR